MSLQISNQVPSSNSSLNINNISINIVTAPNSVNDDTDATMKKLMKDVKDLQEKNNNQETEIEDLKKSMINLDDKLNISNFIVFSNERMIGELLTSFNDVMKVLYFTEVRNAIQDGKLENLSKPVGNLKTLIESLEIAVNKAQSEVVAPKRKAPRARDSDDSQKTKRSKLSNRSSSEKEGKASDLVENLISSDDAAKILLNLGKK